jgi:hypothetical protein
MKKDFKQRFWQFATSLLCLALVWRYGSGLGGTEFSGGRLTGPLLDMYDVGTFLFVPALLLALFFRRVSAAITILASLLCLPLYLYFTAPGPFRRVFAGLYSVPLGTNFVWSKWGIGGIIALILAVCIATRSFLVVGTRSDKSASASGKGESSPC